VIDVLILWSIIYSNFYSYYSVEVKLCLELIQVFIK
jgi:hypothetical protein